MAKLLESPNQLAEKVRKTRAKRSGHPFRYRLRNGQHEIELRDPITGKTVSFKRFPKGISKAAAIEWGYEEYKRINAGDLPSERNKRLKDWTLGALIADCIDYVSKHDWISGKPRHVAWEEDNELLRRFVAFHDWLAAKRLDTIKVEDWQRQMNDRLNGLNGVRKVSGDTWTREATVVSYVLYYYAPEIHQLPVPNWHKQIKFKPKQKTLRTNRVLKPGEFEKIQAEVLKCPYFIVNLQYSLILHWLYETCVRRGALTKIKWKHIDWAENGYTQEPEKYSKRRYIPLRLAFMERLRAYYNEMPESMRGLDCYVFWNSRGKRKGNPYRERQVTQTFAEYFARAGITNTREDPDGGFCLHMLRHTAMNRYRTMGMVEQDIEYMAGHKVGGNLQVPTYWLSCTMRIRDVIDPGWRDRLAVKPFTPDNVHVSTDLDHEWFMRLSASYKGKLISQCSKV
jgi:integrase